MRTIISRIPSGVRHRRGLCCIEIGYPWLTRGAIIVLEEILKPYFSVLELGCGGSTIFFANKCKMVKSFDFSQEWIDKVKEKVGDKVEFMCGDYDYILDRINSEPDGKYDVALVDIGEDSNLRLGLADACKSKIRKGGYFVIDNYGGNGISKFDCNGWDVYTFDDLINYRDKIKPHQGKGTRILVKQ